MQDRVPLYPGRVKMTPVSGQANTYDMTRADDPTQAGTPLNKATLLKDATAALFGMSGIAVPDDVFAYLGQYAEHWWKRRAISGHYEESIATSDTTVTLTDEDVVRYSSGISFDSSGNITLENPKTYSTPVTDWYYLDTTLLEKYFTVDDDANVYYLAATGRTASSTSIKLTHARIVTANYVETPGSWSYVQSSDRSAYPDSGTSGGYEYEYLGIPFDNAVTAPKIEMGSYVGTGTYGASNPSQITFGFIPQVVVFLAYVGVVGTTGVRSINSLLDREPVLIMSEVPTDDFRNWMPPQASSSKDRYGYTKKGTDGKSLIWYNTNSAGSQMNTSGYTYYYIAIG